MSRWIEAITMAHALAMVVVNLTPTPKDDQAMGRLNVVLCKLYRALEILAGIIGPLAKH